MDSRLDRLRHLLAEQDLDSLLISSTPNITYLTGYSGFSPLEREAYILITNQHAFLFTDARYTEAVNDIAHFSFQEISSQTPFTTLMEAIIKNEKLNKLGMEADNLTVAEFNKIKPLCNTITPCQLSPLRTSKEKNETKAIASACEIGDATFSYIQTKITKGITEKQLALEMELFIRNQGGELSFPTIVAFGENAAIPHHQASDKPLIKNSWMLLDYGVEYKNYCSDMTRTLFYGEPTQEQIHLYESVKQAQSQAIIYLQKQLANRAEIIASTVDKIARDYIVSLNYPSFPHSLGHGIGLEVHEAPHLSPRSEECLGEGMVFSLEPGIYLPGKGGVRIEDLYVIDHQSLTQLTHAPSHFITIS